MKRCAATITVALAVALSGCGTDGGGAAGGGGQSSTAPPPPALPAGALPYLEAKARPLTAAALAHETAVPGLRDDLSRWGYETGFSRSFQGESRRLEVVESRTLRFATPRGATAFVAAVRARPSAFYPGGLTAHDFSSRGRRGIVVRAALCACHMATPAFLGVVSRGRLVTWLEINGPRATVGALARLAARAP